MIKLSITELCMNARSILVAVLLAFGTLRASAATINWIGGSGDWNTFTNWSTGALPGPGDDVVIDVPASVTVTHSAGAHTVKSVRSQEDFVLSGGVLTVSNSSAFNTNMTL